MNTLTRNWWALLVRGLIGIAFGVIAWGWPAMTLMILVTLFGVYAVVDGFFSMASALLSVGALELYAAIRLRRQVKGEWLLGLSGVLALLAGALLVLKPTVGLLTLVWFVGAYAVASGVVLVALAIRLKELRRERPAPLGAGTAQPV